MENWQTIFLGLKQLLRELSAFEIEAFFTFSEAERATIAARRRCGGILLWRTGNTEVTRTYRPMPQKITVNPTVRYWGTVRIPT